MTTQLGDMTVRLKAQYRPPAVGGNPNQVKLFVSAWQTSTGNQLLLTDFDPANLGPPVGQFNVTLWIDGGVGNPGAVVANFVWADFYTPTLARLDEAFFAIQNVTAGAGQDVLMATVDLANATVGISHSEVIQIPVVF